jgi:hypothetical protein
MYNVLYNLAIMTTVLYNLGIMNIVLYNLAIMNTVLYNLTVYGYCSGQSHTLWVLFCTISQFMNTIQNNRTSF